jgi:hypothetical protein
MPSGAAAPATGYSHWGAAQRRQVSRRRSWPPRDLLAALAPGPSRDPALPPLARRGAGTKDCCIAHTGGAPQAEPYNQFHYGGEPESCVQAGLALANRSQGGIAQVGRLLPRQPALGSLPRTRQQPASL